MILALSFLVPDAIASTPVEVPYIETVEQIDSVTARAIAGHTENGKTPRDEGSRDSWLSILFGITKYNSGVIGK